MKAKLYITRAIKISAFILLSALVIGFLQEYVLCHHDANRMRLDAFYIEDKDTIDVAMIGSSEMYSGVSPALLYEKYGVTSFPYATASSTAAAMKTQLHRQCSAQRQQDRVYRNDSGCTRPRQTRVLFPYYQVPRSMERFPRAVEQDDLALYPGYARLHLSQGLQNHSAEA